MIASASPEDECLLYKLANFKKGGQLVEAFTQGGSKNVSDCEVIDEISVYSDVPGGEDDQGEAGGADVQQREGGADHQDGVPEVEV